MLNNQMVNPQFFTAMGHWMGPTGPCPAPNSGHLHASFSCHRWHQLVLPWGGDRDPLWEMPRGPSARGNQRVAVETERMRWVFDGFLVGKLLEIPMKCQHFMVDPWWSIHFSKIARSGASPILEQTQVKVGWKKKPTSMDLRALEVVCGKIIHKAI